MDGCFRRLFYGFLNPPKIAFHTPEKCPVSVLCIAYVALAVGF